jgi:hypothetical protein
VSLWHLNPRRRLWARLQVSDRDVPPDFDDAFGGLHRIERRRCAISVRVIAFFLRGLVSRLPVPEQALWNGNVADQSLPAIADGERAAVSRSQRR